MPKPCEKTEGKPASSALCRRADATAVFTLREIERWLTQCIVGVCRAKQIGGIRTSPLQRWTAGAFGGPQRWRSEPAAATAHGLGESPLPSARLPSSRLPGSVLHFAAESAEFDKPPIQKVGVGKSSQSVDLVGGWA